MANTVRSFIAVEISPNVRARAGQVIKALSVAEGKITWVNPANLHFTLVFLGEVPLIEVPKLCEAMTMAVAGLPPFDLEVRGAGAFPDAARPRTIWLGAGRGTEEMVALHGAVEESLIELGYRPEGRRYRPHITLGRVRQAPRNSSTLIGLVDQHRDYVADVMSVADITLFASRLTKEGPEYEPLGTAELGGA